MKTKLAGAAGRFGVRYGQSARRKIADVESRQRKKQVCPFCEGRAKRLSKGIWLCKKCKRKFASHAYYLEAGAIKVKTDRFAKVREEERLPQTKDLKKQKSKLKKELKAKKAKKSG